jgi:hypothetical protein
MSPRGVEPLPAAGGAVKHWKAAILPLNYRPLLCDHFDPAFMTIRAVLTSQAKFLSARHLFPSIAF